MLAQLANPKRASVRAWLVLSSAVISTGCAGTTRIGTLLDDPSEYDGRMVRVEGEVTQAVGVPILGGTYSVSDGTGTLRVVTEQGGVPREGAEIRVGGIFRALFAIGAESLSVLQESERDVR